MIPDREIIYLSGVYIADESIGLDGFSLYLLRLSSFMSPLLVSEVPPDVLISQ